MASVIFMSGSWYLKWRDGSGRWRRKVSSARTKKEAQRLADDLERASEPQRMGLAPALPTNGGESVAELLRWWLKTYSEGRPGHAANISHAKHILGCDGDTEARPPRPPRPAAPFASCPVYRLRFGEVNSFMQAKHKEGLAPQTRRHIRRTLHSAFERARDEERFLGENPIKRTKAPRVPKTTVGDYLREHEVDPVLGALNLWNRPLFATAIFEALRKKELLTLRKTDIDFDGMRLRVGPSKQTPEDEWIPLHRDVVPWLREAVRMSPSDLVFPSRKGKQRRLDSNLSSTFRAALARAGIVTGYVHRCRKKDCAHTECAPDAAVRRCPEHGDKLWPKAQVRPIRFHDLRHTAATLMLRAGGGLPAVQKLLRHSDPKTTQIYAHLEQEWVRETMNRVDLKLTIRPQEEEPVSAKVPESLSAAGSMGGQSAEAFVEGLETERDSLMVSATCEVRDEGVEPTTFGSGGAYPNRPAIHSASQPRDSFRSSHHSQVQRSHLDGTDASASGQWVVNTPGRLRPRVELLDVRQVAERLAVSPATVYRLCDLGHLRHVRVLNAIRVHPDDLAAFIAKSAP